MANFLLYKYKFEKTDERLLFSDKEGETLSNEALNNMLNKALISAFKESANKSLTLYSIKGEGEPESYPNDIRNSIDGVTMLEVRNNKTKKVMPLNKNEEEAIGHYPICWVFIDSRPTSTAILVQQKFDVFPKTETVVELLSDYVSRTLDLSTLGWKLTTEKRICKGSIWDLVRTRTTYGHDRVKCLTLKFDGKRPANPDCQVDTALQMILEKLASPEGEIKLSSDDPAKKLLDETMPDVKNTVDLLIENQYRIKVGFDKSGSFEYGKNADAIYGIEDNFCTMFKDGESVITDAGQGFELIFWLDKLMPDDTEHEYSTIQKKNRTRNGR